MSNAKSSVRRTLLDVAICLAALEGLYAARGSWLAHKMQGSYPIRSLLFHMAALSTLVLVLRGLDANRQEFSAFVVYRLSRRHFRRSARCRRALRFERDPLGSKGTLKV